MTLTYIDPFYTPTEWDYVVKTTVNANTGVTGMLDIVDMSGLPLEQFRLGDTIYLQVQDSDLPMPAADTPSESQPTVMAYLSAVETDEREAIQLSYQPEQGRYVGSIETTYSETPQGNDGQFQAVGTQTVRGIYIDDIQATGETGVRVTVDVAVEIGDSARLRMVRPSEEIVKDTSVYRAEIFQIWRSVNHTALRYRPKSRPRPCRIDPSEFARESS